MAINYDEMSLNELRQYMLSHREDIEAFHAYVDRSKAEGRMITVDPTDDRWEEKVEARIREILDQSSDAAS
jgi:hypothetical protein